MGKEIKISKLCPYPTEEPTGFAVGFTFGVNGRTGYLDTAVSYDEATTDEEAVQIALQKLGESINSQLDTMASKSPLVWTVVELPEVEPTEE